MMSSFFGMVCLSLLRTVRNSILRLPVKSESISTREADWKTTERHYPQCLVSAVYDVFRRLPAVRTVVECNGPEREEMKNLLPFVPAGSIWAFDRGYPAYEALHFLNENYSGYWLFRYSKLKTRY